jgi:hypothetical protein
MNIVDYDLSTQIISGMNYIDCYVPVNYKIPNFSYDKYDIKLFLNKIKAKYKIITTNKWIDGIHTYNIIRFQIISYDKNKLNELNSVSSKGISSKL